MTQTQHIDVLKLLERLITEVIELRRDIADMKNPAPENRKTRRQIRAARNRKNPSVNIALL
jgi:hypothetical protein